MNWQLRALLLLAASLGTAQTVSAQFAVEVTAYDAGTSPASMDFTQPAAALGSPERITGEVFGFPGPVTPFNPPFQSNEIVSIGESGELVLRLSNFVLPQVGSPEIGVFVNVGLIDFDFPNGQVGDPVGTFGGIEDSAEVAVSANGVDWVSLGNLLLNKPTNAFTDAAATVEADFQQPFAESLDSLAGLIYSHPTDPNVLDLLAGSGGGNWLDISDTGLSQVGFIRFSVADDGNPNTGLNFELDAVSIASNAIGASTVPEPNTVALLCVSLLSMLGTRRR